MRLAKIDWALGAVLAAMTVGVSACGSSSSSTVDEQPADEHRRRRGPAEPRRVGRLRAARMGEAVRTADRLRGARQVRGLLRRNGDADAPGRAASTTWSPPPATRACA